MEVDNPSSKTCKDDRQVHVQGSGELMKGCDPSNNFDASLLPEETGADKLIQNKEHMDESEGNTMPTSSKKVVKPYKIISIHFEKTKDGTQAKVMLAPISTTASRQKDLKEGESQGNEGKKSTADNTEAVVSSDHRYVRRANKKSKRKFGVKSSKSQLSSCKEKESKDITDGSDVPKIEDDQTKEANINKKANKRIKTVKGPKKCDICEKVFKQANSLKAHIRIHTGERPFKCDICGREFNQASSLKTHRRIHSGDKPYECDICNKSFNQSSSLVMHKRIHRGETPYECNICGKGFNNSANLRRHSRIHSGEKPYQCGVCGKEFNQSGSLKSHQRAHPGGYNQHESDIAIKGLDRESDLKEDEGNKEEQAKESDYLPDVSGKEFDVSCFLITDQQIPEEGNPFTWDEYGKEFNQLETRQEILPEENLDLCDVPSESLCEKSSLNQQEETKEEKSEEKKYACDVCAKRFKLLCNLVSHKRIHTGERPFKCDICDKTFSQASSRRTHRRIHTGERPFKCEVCGKEFNQSTSFKTHQRIHRGEKPYECSTCGKGFSDLANRRRHLRIHSGEKPYKCDICGKEFNQSNSFKSHKRTHAGNEAYECDMSLSMVSQVV